MALKIKLPNAANLPRELDIPQEIYESDRACGEFIVTLNESLAYIRAIEKLFKEAQEKASNVMLERLEVTGFKHFAFDFGTFTPRTSTKIGFPAQENGGKAKAAEWLKELLERDIISFSDLLDVQQSRITVDAVKAIEESVAEYNKANPHDAIEESPFNHYVETKLSTPTKRR